MIIHLHRNRMKRQQRNRSQKSHQCHRRRRLKTMAAPPRSQRMMEHQHWQRTSMMGPCNSRILSSFDLLILQRRPSRRHQPKQILQCSHHHLQLLLPARHRHLRRRKQATTMSATVYCWPRTRPTTRVAKWQAAIHRSVNPIAMRRRTQDPMPTRRA